MLCVLIRIDEAILMSTHNIHNIPTYYKKEKNKDPKLCQICDYGILFHGTQEGAVVNEPSVFEPLKFY